MTTCITLDQDVALNYPFRQILFVQVERVKAHDRATTQDVIRVSTQRWRRFNTTGLLIFTKPPSPSFLRWKGDCGGKKQQWFPANYVEEISPSAAEPDRTVRVKLLRLQICILKK